MSMDKVAAGRGIMGSLREALAAASRSESQRAEPLDTVPPAALAAVSGATGGPAALDQEEPQMNRPQKESAAEAARDARGGTPNIPPADRHFEPEPPPTTRLVRQAKPAEPEAETARTQFVRGRGKIERTSFQQDPVVGWLVVVGGPGLGAFRPIYEGNNTVGRSTSQRIALDFGDEAISAEEQAYIRYDGSDRSFLFVPNLSKTNVVALNDRRPTSAVALQAMDVITMGRTQLAFVPFCGPEFDWAEISEAKA